MGRGRGRWVVLVAAAWVQVLTGTNLDFPAYSAELRSAMGISQVQLSYLATASDMGKALGWVSGIALIYLPLTAVLIISAAIGAASYFSLWLLLTQRISLPYLPAFLLCFLAGCSICWFNTICVVLCIKNFPMCRSLALSLTMSFNGLSAALYALVAHAIDGGTSPSLYLLLNAVLPILATMVALIPIRRQSTTSIPLSSDAIRLDAYIFLRLNILAFITGLYLLFLGSSSSIVVARILLVGAVILLLLPLSTPLFRIPLTTYSHLHLHHNSPATSKKLIEGNKHQVEGTNKRLWWWNQCSSNKAKELDRLKVLGEEHSAKKLVRRIDFWLYYVSYFCGATLGLVYSNNLGQISESLGRKSQTTMLITVYSSSSFFGRLLSSAPDFLHRKVKFARTGWMAIALLPMPLAFFLLAEAGDGHALLAGTALIGLSSGFIFSAAISITSELFGPNSAAVNHNILISNIPIGSLLYGRLAAHIYNAHGSTSPTFFQALPGNGMVLCMGRQCYTATFAAWGCITLVGVASSTALFSRTRHIYDQACHSRAFSAVIEIADA